MPKKAPYADNFYLTKTELADVSGEIRDRHLGGFPLLTPAVAHTVLLLRIIELLEAGLGIHIDRPL